MIMQYIGNAVADFQMEGDPNTHNIRVKETETGNPEFYLDGVKLKDGEYTYDKETNSITLSILKPT